MQKFSLSQTIRFVFFLHHQFNLKKTIMKNRIFLLSFALICGLIQLSAQTNTFPTSGSVGIGTLTPNASAAIDVVSTSQGLLAPRMTKVQRDAIVSPATGLLVFQTNSTPGFYYYSGAAWTAISSKGANTSLSNLVSTAINLSLLPNATGSLDLGSSTFRWDEGYINTLRFSDGTSMTTAAVGGGGGVGGSGTTNYLPKFTGTTTLGNSSIYETASQIGIGTTSPSYKVDVRTTGTTTLMNLSKAWVGSGTTNFPLLQVSNTYTFGYGTGVSGSGGQTGVKGTASNGDQTGYGIYGLGFGASGNTYGVYGTASTTAGTSYGVYGTVTAGSGWAGYFDGKGYFSGNLGLGITSAATRLQIDGGTDAGLASGGFITNGLTTSTNLVIDNNEIMARYNGGTSTLYLNNDGGNISMCYSSGNVMIGASVPATGYLFSVDGKIMCEELKVQMSESWPDYVFADDYKLPSLYELEASIKLNKHLPGIPSAKEVEANGFEVGAMQANMMEKIEELTLYIIELQKQIDQLKDQQ